MYKPLLAITLVALAGCTAVSVEPLAEKPQHMCIKRNPKVIIEDFVPVLQAGLRRHGIESTLYDSVPLSCSQIMEYTARRSWDMAPYLSTADLLIRDRQDRRLAKAHYHLRAKGGFSLLKWASVESKMNPVIDQLLARAVVPAPPPALPQTPESARRMSQIEQLEALKATHPSYEEYQRRYREIMAQ